MAFGPLVLVLEEGTVCILLQNHKPSAKIPVSRCHSSLSIKKVKRLLLAVSVGKCSPHSVELVAGRGAFDGEAEAKSGVRCVESPSK